MNNSFNLNSGKKKEGESPETAATTSAGFDDPFFDTDFGGRAGGGGFGGGFSGFGGAFGGGNPFDDLRRQAEGSFKRYVKGWSPFGKSSGISRDKYR